MKYVDLAIGGIGIVAASLAAYWWLKASLVEVPDNLDTFIGELQRAARLNAYGAAAACAAAVCAVYTFIRQFVGSL